jgi:uncharacterized protein (TIGR03067 family)
MRYSLSVAALLLVGSPLLAQPSQRIPSDTLARLQEWAGLLVRQLDEAADVVNREVRDPVRRQAAARQAEDVLGDALTFQRMLVPGITEVVLIRQYRALNGKLDPMLTSLAGLVPQHPGVREVHRHLQMTDGRLDQLMAGQRPDPLPGSGIVRQARLVEAAARELTEVLVPLPRSVTAHRQADRFVQAAADFRARAEGGEQYEALRRAYVGVDQAWDQLDRTLLEMGLRSHYLIRARWQRAEAQHEALAGLLRIEALEVGDVAQQLQGPWGIVSIYSGGVPEDLRQFGQQRYVFKGNTWTILEDTYVVSAGTFRIVDATGPIKKMDMVATQGKNPGERIEAIFTLRNNLLRFAPAPVRPTEFGLNYYTVWRKLAR